MKADKRKVIYLPLAVAMLAFVCLVSLVGMLVVGCERLIASEALKSIRVGA